MQVAGRVVEREGVHTCRSNHDIQRISSFELATLSPCLVLSLLSSCGAALSLTTQEEEDDEARDSLVSSITHTTKGMLDSSWGMGAFDPIP